MQLHDYPTSPYARKVMVTALELGLAERIESITVDPWDVDNGLHAINPLGKVPALEIEGGDVLYDSPVICEFLDNLHDGDKLFPRDGGSRWTVLKLQALADGIADASVLAVTENRRNPERRSQKWLTRQRKAIRCGLDSLEKNMPELVDRPLCIAHIAVACTLGYVDYRKPIEEDWREGRPGMDAWYAEFSKRDSMVGTVPREPD